MGAGGQLKGEILGELGLHSAGADHDDRAERRINGEFAGDGKWYKDPTDTRKGDTVCAGDGTGEGYYIRAELAVGLSADTNHDTAPAVHCKTQNLPEGHTFNMRVCVVKGEAICSRWYSVTA
ncbi:hypothetical protein [Streptomyces sp. NPDC055400]